MNLWFACHLAFCVFHCATEGSGFVTGIFSSSAASRQLGYEMVFLAGGPYAYRVRFYSRTDDLQLNVECGNGVPQSMYGLEAGRDGMADRWDVCWSHVA